MLYFVTNCDPADAGCDQANALEYYRDATALWSNPRVATQCHSRVSNLDNPCFDAALLLVQASGLTSSVFISILTEFIDNVITPNAANGLM
jgi:hypothetical protein